MMALLILLALLQELGYVFLLKFAPFLDQKFQFFPIFLGVWGALFLIYFFSLKKLQQKTSDSSAQVSTSCLWVILFSALIFRFTMLFMNNLVLSYDLYIYVWFGRLQAHGFNPYLYTPMDPLLEHLRDDIWNHIAFKNDLPVYPAFLMKCFQMLQFVPEIITMLAGVALLKAYGKSPLWILIYAWCPLPIIEYLGMGHSDAWGIAFVTLFLLFFKKQKISLAALSLALAVMVKIFPIIFTPLIFFRLSWKDRFRFGLFFLATIMVCYLPFLSAGEKILGALPVFVKNYQFNGSIYHLLNGALGRADWAHRITNLLIMTWILVVALKKLSWPGALMATFFGFLLLSYQVFPWYLGYLLPLLLLVTNWGAYAWLLTSILSYVVLINFRLHFKWNESPWILLAEYLPVYALILIQWVRALNSPHPEVSSTKNESSI
jgi:hypothetical protein